MTIAFRANGPVGFAKTGTTVVATFAAAVNVGELLVVSIGADNIRTTDGAGADDLSTLVDSKGNTYVYAYGYTLSTGVAQGGVNASIYYSVITTALASSDTLTATFTTSGAYARAISTVIFTKSAGTTISVAATGFDVKTGGADPTAAVSGLTSGSYLFCAALTDENTAAVGAPTGWTRGPTGAVTSGGVANTNVYSTLNYAYNTASTGKSFTPLANADNAAVIVALKENGIYFGSIANVGYGSKLNTTIVAPTGIAQNDLLVMQFLVATASPTFTPPAGWTLLGTKMVMTDLSSFILNSHIYTKIATASEGANYAFSHSALTTQAAIARYGGTNGAPTVFSSNVGSTSVSISLGTSITTLTPNNMLLFVGNDWGDTTTALSPPTGMTERLEVNPLIYWAEEARPTPGPTGDRTMTVNSASGNPRGAWMIALVPEGAVADPGAAYVTGQELTTAVGTATVTANRVVSTTVAGQAVTASVGAATVATVTPVSVTAVGQEVITLVGQVDVSIPIPPINVTGQEVAVSVGQVTYAAPVTTTPVTQASNALVGQVTVTVVTSFNVVGQQVAVSVGQVTVVGKAIVNVLGQATTVSVGDVTVTAKQAPSVGVLGQSVTASVGQVTVNVGASINVVGQAVTVSLGTATVSAGGSISVSVVGQAVTVVLGVPVEIANFGVSVPVTGVVATVSVDPGSTVGLGLKAFPTGVAATAQVGQVIARGAATVGVLGVQSNINVGQLVVNIGTIASRMKCWTGSSWSSKPILVWTGTAWKNVNVKYWDGTVWR